MRLNTCTYGFKVLLVLCSFQYSFGQLKVEVINGQRTAVTGSLKNWTPDVNDPILKIKTRDEKGLIHAQDLKPLIFKRYQEKKKTEDALWYKSRNKNTLPEISSAKNSTSSTLYKNQGNTFVNTTIEGQPYSKINPADPSLAVGPNHIIQMIIGNNGSALFSILDKSGNVMVPSAYMDQLPGASYNGGGDCITWYDQFSDRFVMSEFGDSSKTGIQMNSLILAVSATNDPTGSWYIYEFYSGDFFPDYPKYGNWPSAWFGVTRDFTSEYQGNSIWAFNKFDLLNGKPIAQVVRTRLTDPDDKYNSLVPVTTAGSFQTNENKGLFLYFNDDELTASPTDVDSLTILSFTPNFTNPSQSILSVEKSIKTAPFSSQVCATRNCAPSPAGGYDVISDRLMHKPYVRDFGSYQSIVVNHAVDVNGNGLAGIRWYEWRKNGNWDLFQQGTFSPQEPSACNEIPRRHRFMGSILQNAKGQIALGYNYSSSADFASLAVSGRNNSDALGEMSYDEKVLTKGTEYGTEGFRWGDYNDMVPDPTQDSVFWFTGMYGFTSATWKTSIHSIVLRKNFSWDAKLVEIEYPTSCTNLCNGRIAPKIRIKNNGEETINTLIILCNLNNNELSRLNWTGLIIPGAENSIALPEINFPEGMSKLKIEILNPNGNQDENKENDLKEVELTVAFASTLPYTVDAEDGRMPPQNWILTSTGSNGYGWKVSTQASYKGQNSFWVNNFDFNEKGKTTELVSPRISIADFDSVQLSFGLSAALFDTKARDTLELMVSSDCGATYSTVYKKWGESLATKNGFVTNSFIPISLDWRKEIIDLSSYLGKQINLKIKVTNDFGNNIYIDDIRFEGINFSDHDVAIESFSSPKLVGCENAITPVISFRNLGKRQLSSVDISIWQNGIKKETKKWTGILNRLGTGLISFSSLAALASNDLIAVVENVNGTLDQNRSQDTLRTSYFISSLKTSPWSEDFNSTSAISLWPSSNIGHGDSWERVSVPLPRLFSLSIKNYKKIPFTSSTYSPRLRIAKADSVYLYFDLAAANSLGKSDTLQIECSFNCGESWDLVYKKGGNELQTSVIGNYDDFIPQKESDWRREKIDLTILSKEKEEVLLRWTNIGGGNNNIYIDNVSVIPSVLPDQLKERGWLLSPNPTTDFVYVRFYPNGREIKSIILSDLLGRKLRSWEVRQDSFSQTIPIDMRPYPAGTYALQLIYADNTETILVVKSAN